MKLKKFIKISAIISLVIAIIILGLTLIFVTETINEVRDIEVKLTGENINYSSIYDKNKNQLSSTKNLKNNYISLENINEDTINAFLSIEDKKFYEHNGLNYKRIAKAVITNIINKSYIEGASTISQQLIKNKYLTNEKTIKRKIKEAYLTKKLEKNENKDKILEAYLNTIYYGNGAYGIANASHRFFNKKPHDLSLSESAILAGVVKSPYSYSPINNIENCRLRRNLVLKEMLEDNKISKEEYNIAINEDISVDEQEIVGINNFDLYSQYVLHEASQILNMSKEEILIKGYKIYTYQDNSIQNTLNEIINNPKYYQENQYGNIADSLSMILDNKSAGVIAIAGKSDYNLVNFKRQPGSLVKPILVYAPALDRGIIYPCSKILDEKTTINGYSPQNVGDKYYGYVSVYDAVAESLNIPAIKICNDLSIEASKEYGKNCGLEFSNEDQGLAIALGGLTNGVTLQNITESYLPFSNNGISKKSAFIKEIKNLQNITIYNNQLSESNYCSAETSYLMTDILKHASKNGTAKKLSNLSYDVCAKTGTVNVKNSNLNTDAYSLAYNTSHTMSVWLGNYSMKKEYNLEGNNNGGTFATQIILDTFNNIYLDKQPSDFTKPTSIVSLPIDHINLEKNHVVSLANNLPEKDIKYEIFSSKHQPTKYSNRLDEIPTVTLQISKSKNYISLSFDTYDYFSYQIYRQKENSKPQVINTINNHDGKYCYNDYNLDFNIEYKYYIKVYSIHSNKHKFSNSETITLTKDFNSIINNTNDNISWLFAG